MEDIVIIGTGGLATEVKYLIDAINKDKAHWNLLGFIDDWGLKRKNDEIIDGYKHIGSIEDLNNTSGNIFVVLAFGKSQYIKEAVEKISNPNIKFANLIHPSVEINSIENIGYGNIICFGSFISCNVKVGNFNFFNTKCAVGHDVCIGSFNIFNPNSQISGSVTIGNENLWGLNSSVIQGKKIGNNNVIGACSFVLRNIGNNESLFGIPAKKLLIP